MQGSGQKSGCRPKTIQWQRLIVIFNWMKKCYRTAGNGFFFLNYFYIYQICNKVGEGAIQEGQCLLVGYTRRGWGGGGVVKVVKIQGRKREGLGLGFQIEGHCWGKGGERTSINIYMYVASLYYKIHKI